jgi:hypothetical protein
LSIVPESEQEVAGLSVLLLDDPPGLSPEARTALERWVREGGVLVGLLGPAANSAELASTLEPFVRGGATWEKLESPLSVDAKSMSWLGPEAESLEALSRTGRMRLDGAELSGSETVGSWQDGVPFVVRRSLDRGVVYAVGLPASVDHSDFALRPGFLGLLARFVEQAEQRAGPAQSEAGGLWTFSNNARVTIVGPRGALQPKRDTRPCPPTAPDCSAENQSQVVELDHAGRYSVSIDDVTSERVVTLTEKEVERASVDAADLTTTSEKVSATSQVDISSEVALELLLLFSLEMLFLIVGGRLRLHQI